MYVYTYVYIFIHMYIYIKNGVDEERVFPTLLRLPRGEPLNFAFWRCHSLKKLVKIDVFTMSLTK